MKIVYTSKFVGEFKKLPAKVKDTAEKQEVIFRRNPFNEKLKIHKLKGRLKGFLSFSIGPKYRIIFEFGQNKNIVYFHSVGDHDIYG